MVERNLAKVEVASAAACKAVDAGSIPTPASSQDLTSLTKIDRRDPSMPTDRARRSHALAASHRAVFAARCAGVAPTVSTKGARLNTSTKSPANADIAKPFQSRMSAVDVCPEHAALRRPALCRDRHFVADNNCPRQKRPPASPSAQRFCSQVRLVPPIAAARMNGLRLWNATSVGLSWKRFHCAKSLFCVCARHHGVIPSEAIRGSAAHHRRATRQIL